MGERVGFGFRPTDVELVGYYLHNKIKGMTSLAEEIIKEINAYDFDPWDLPFQSKLKSRDHVWYFFCPMENKYGNGDQQNMRTTSGSWKITGYPVDIKDRLGVWSETQDKIGEKRTLVFHKNRMMDKTEWVMHEYNLPILPQNQMSHVLCKVEYKGDDITFLCHGATEPCPAFVHQLNATVAMNQAVQEKRESLKHFSGDLNTQKQVDYFGSNDTNIEEVFEFLFDKGEINTYTYMQENCSRYRPKNPVTKVFDEYSSDSDNESMLFGHTSSSKNSVCKSNELRSISIDQPTTKLDKFGSRN